MTSEQAVKNLKEIIELSKDEINKKDKNLTAILDLIDLESLDIVLFMLENQKERIDYLMRSIERKEQSLIEEHEENIECYTKIEEKDKIIDEMTKTINEAYYASGDFEEWFENKICKIQRYEDYTYLEKDIKQYFENKAKEVQ